MKRHYADPHSKREKELSVNKKPILTLSAELVVPDGQDEVHSESTINLSLLDPARWGWTASGCIIDLLPPHERARRSESKRIFLKRLKQSRETAAKGHFAPKPSDTSQLPQKGRTELAQKSRAEEDLEVATSIIHVPSEKTKISNTARYLRNRNAENEKKTKSSSAIKPIQFCAVHSGNSSLLDMYTYHRGREGVELRDENTGDLLCDVEATDTSFGSDAPNLLVPVKVEFPLEDTLPAGDDNRCYFRELLCWDLGDAETPTPMLFASDTAEKFGLSYPQMLELAESIEVQLHSWVRANCSYSQPVILNENSSEVARERPPSIAYSLYGEVVGSSPGGILFASLDDKKKPTIKSSRASMSKPTSSTRENPRRFIPSDGRKASAKRSRSAKYSNADEIVEEIYLAEVRRRLRSYSIAQIQSQSTREPFGKILLSSNVFCQICLENVELGGSFACGFDHFYCAAHLSEYFGTSIHSDPTASVTVTPSIIDYCPVCSLEYPRSDLSLPLRTLGLELKTKTLEQCVDVRETIFDNIWDMARNLLIRETPMPNPAIARNKKRVQPPRNVRKIPLSDFPREVCNGVDIHPGDELDYRTVYLPSGLRVVKDIPSNTETDFCQIASTSSSRSPIEDGSVGYCMVCMKHGNLICCDFCPRAYHAACICYNVDDQPDTPLECVECVREKQGIPLENIDGSNSLQLITSTYTRITATASDAVTIDVQERLRLLAVAHEMLGYLIDYSFGYIFGKPVDPKQVPTYHTIIKHPMDLGTISSRLETGRYFEEANNANLDNVLASVLKDTELVWHNCFTFNLPGSAIYRMAEVQRRAAIRIQTVSINPFLDESVKIDVQDFISACQVSREQTINSATSERIKPRVHETSSTPKARYKITVSLIGQKTSRPIAVLDPLTGMIVKIYSSLQAACQVIDLFRRLKYECESDLAVIDRYQKIRLIVKNGKKEPNRLLFGYRWLWLDELRNGKVTIAAPEEYFPSKSEEVVVLSPTVKVTESCNIDSPIDSDPILNKSDLIAPHLTSRCSSSCPSPPREEPVEVNLLNPCSPVLKLIEANVDSQVQSVVESPSATTPETPNRKLPAETTEYLKAWMLNHTVHPYPTNEEKQQIIAATGIDPKKLLNWFINHRRRHWKGRTNEANTNHVTSNASNPIEPNS